MNTEQAMGMLQGMFRLLADDPRRALQLDANASAEQVRQAFLQVSKQYHPVKFARCDASVQRLANEVFLKLRDAQAQLSAPPVATPRTISGNISGAPTEMRATGSNRVVAASQPGTSRAATPPLGVAVTRQTTPTTPPTPAVTRTSTPPALARASMPGHAQSQLQTGSHRAMTPAVGGPTTASSATSSSGATPPAVARTSTARDGVAATRLTGAHAIAKPAATGPSAARFDEATTFRDGKELLRQKSYSKARDLFASLVARVPNQSAYKAMHAFARGQLALEAKDWELARSEFELALSFEPSFAAATHAIAELAKNERSLWDKLRGK